MVKRSRAYKYAKWCVEEDNVKVGGYVKKQAAAWLKIADGKQRGVYVCQKTFKAVSVMLKLMMHPDFLKPLHDTIEDYAWLLIVATLCTKERRVDGASVRWYETAVLEIARKNFKTFNSAIIFILLMLTSPKSSRFFSVAPDLKLSSELKLAVRKIIKASPALLAGNSFETLRSEIRCNVTDSVYIPLAYSNDRMDGKLATAFLADEAGAMDEYPIEAMRSSQITLKNKLGIIISTQYPNDSNGMTDEIDKSKKALDGLIEDRRFALLYEPDDGYLAGDKWQTDDTVIYQSNPASVNNQVIFDALLKRRQDAVLYENKRENYLCKHNNIKYRGLGVEGYVEITKVRECRIKEDLGFWMGKRVFVGLDLSLTDDNTAVAVVTLADGLIHAKAWGFIPQEKVGEKTNRENVDYPRLIRSGCCYACGDEVIGYRFVEDHIIGMPNRYGVEIVQAGYDRMNAISTVQKLEAAGIECVEIKQHSSVLHSATKLLKERILSKTFRYDENLLLEINFQNARCTEDTNLNKYVNKKKSSGKVDMVAALINAVYLLEQEMLYEQPEFEFIML